MSDETEIGSLLRGAAATSDAARRFSDSEIDAMYAMACDEYERGNWHRAAQFFRCMRVYRPACERIVKGLGASELKGGFAEQAVQSYALAVLLAPGDAEALCMYGQALLLIGADDEARAALVCAVESSANEPLFGQRAAALLRLAAQG